MRSLTRWLAPAALIAALGAGALFPAAARADDDLARVIVDVADIVFRSGQPYYRYGDYGYNDRLIVERDYRNRPVYYRYVPRDAYGYNRNRGYDHYSRNGFVRDPYGRYSRQRCDSRGRCKVEYYDPRYDRSYGYRDDDRHHRNRDWDHRRRYDD